MREMLPFLQPILYLVNYFNSNNFDMQTLWSKQMIFFGKIINNAKEKYKLKENKNETIFDEMYSQLIVKIIIITLDLMERDIIGAITTSQ